MRDDAAGVESRDISHDPQTTCAAQHCAGVGLIVTINSVAQAFDEASSRTVRARPGADSLHGGNIATDESNFSIMVDEILSNPLEEFYNIGQIATHKLS
jgi:hypothetical protein